MDQKDITIKNLKSLLSEAQADANLSKLVEETSVDEVEGTKLPEGVKENVEEDNPEVKTDDVIETLDSAEDVEGIENKELAEETSVDEVEGVKLPEGVKEEVKEDNPEVKTDDVIDTVDSSEDVEGLENKDLEEETSIDEVEGTKLPEGVLERKPEEDNPEVETDDVIETLDSSEDVEGLENKELEEETSVDEVEGVELPEGVLERAPEEDNPEVETDDVIETLDSAEDVEGIENEDLEEETSIDEVEGVKLPEGVLEKAPEEDNPEVKTDDVIDTVDSAEDVEGLENKELEESIDKLNSFIDSLREETSVDEVEGTELPEGVKEEVKEDNPEVKTDDVIETLDSAKDVEGIENEDKPAEKAPEAKEYKADCAVEATGGVEHSPLANLEDGNDYKSLKEAIKLGKDYFNTTEKVNVLKEQVAILLAKENEDLLYEELVRLESQAAAIREHLEKKYSVVANNRVDNLLESMEAAEAKIAANKNNMFKKLQEQQELNKVVSSAKTLADDEVIF